MSGILNIGELSAKNLPLSLAKGGVGTWTLAYATGIVSQAVAAAAQSSTLAIPVALPKFANSAMGSPTQAKIASFYVDYTVGTAALSGNATATIYKVVKAVDGDAPTTSTVTCTVAARGTITDIKTVDDHGIVITPSSDVSLTGDDSLVLEVTFPQAATSTVAVKNAVVNSYPIIG
jgi:hypothetical protein